MKLKVGGGIHTLNMKFRELVMNNPELNLDVG
jgi:hypothetical protein